MAFWSGHETFRPSPPSAHCVLDYLAPGGGDEPSNPSGTASEQFASGLTAYHVEGGCGDGSAYSLVSAWFRVYVLRTDA